MAEELNLKGKWWLPDKDSEKFEGSLTFDHHLQRGMLSIISEAIFEISEFDRKDKYDIILGETTEGQKVSLHYCERQAIHHSSQAPGEYSITAKDILLGWHFKKPEDIVFSSIYVTYRGDKIHRWIKTVYLEALSKSKNSVEARIGDECIISVTAKRRSSSWSEGEVQKKGQYLEYCIEITSLKEKHLAEYSKLNTSVFDFLNFIIPQEVHIESIHGALQHAEKDSKENTMSNQQHDEMKIFYASLIKKMFKSPYYMHQLFPYDESQRGSIPELFQKYLQMWFQMSVEFKPLLDRYFGVMYNPEEYSESRFLSLAQGLEAYHKILKGQTSSRHRIDYRERVAELYEQYSEIADILFKFRDVECFSRKVTKTRHFLSHGSQGKANGVVFGDDLFWLTLDLQLLLQFCIMEKIGFTKEDIVGIYGTDFLLKGAYGR